MPITLLNTRITVEWQVGDPKGDSWTDPFILDDIVAASVAGSWDPAVTKQGRQIYIPYSLYIQGADTYFQAENRQVCFDGVIVDSYMLYIYDVANFRSPTNEDIMSWYDVRGALKYMRFGANSVIENSSFSNIATTNFYGCTVKTTTYVNCDVLRTSYGGDSIVFDDITIIDGINGILPLGSFTSAQRVKIISCTHGMLLTVSADFSNLYVADCTNSYTVAPNAVGRVINITDSVIDETKYLIYTWYVGDMNINLKSTFKINIADGDGGTAKLYDKDNNLIFSEVLSGELKKSVIYYNHYIETEIDNLIADDKTTYEPFKLVVSKETFRDLIIPGIIVNPGEQTRIFAEIVKPIYYQQSISGSVSDKEVSGSVEVIEISGTKNN